MKYILTILLLLANTVQARAFKQKYKYYLDVGKAEGVLAGIRFPEPLKNEQWLQILNRRKGASLNREISSDEKSETYLVKNGDTLWGIASKLVKDPFLWRKLWETNYSLGNPHELEIGQILTLYREGDHAGVIKIPLVRLRKGGASDIDEDTFVNVNIKNRFTPRVLVTSNEEFLGEITGAYTEKE